MTTGTETPIAIVGMSCLFPQAPDLSTYWRNIVAGRVCTGAIPEDHSWSPDDQWDPDQKAPDKTYSRAGGFLSKVPFDPMQHGLTPSALDATDTTQLLALIVAREALKDAGIDPDGAGWPRHRTSCILGVTGTQELAITLGARLQGPAWKKAMLVARHAFSAAPTSAAAAVEARLRQLVHRLSTGAWRMTATATESGLYAVTVEADPPSLPADCEVWVELLCRPSRQPLGRHIAWHDVRLSDLSAFVAVHVRFTACTPTMTKTFAIKTQLATRLDEARRNAVFRDIVGTPQRLLNYLTLLVDPGSTKSKWLRGESQGEGAEVFGFDVTNGLYEQLLRAASRAPERVRRAVEVAQRVSASGVQMPDGLLQLLDAFRGASEGARR